MCLIYKGFVLFSLILGSLGAVHCELYTSVDELARWSQEMRRFTDKLDELIQMQEIKLFKLKQIRKTIIPVVNEIHSKPLVDPVHVFVTLNRLHNAINVVSKLPTEDRQSIMLDYESEPLVYDMQASDNADVEPVPEFEQFKLKLQDDLRGSGMALLRLQAFYELNITHLMNGNVLPNGSLAFKMDANDCFELGRIAYLDEQYGRAIVWLYAALELAINKKDIGNIEHDKELLIDDILDHMAFAAYKLGLVDYSARLTRAWLERDPENERARENLEYYLDVLDSSQENFSAVEEETVHSFNITDIGNLSNQKYFQEYKNLVLEEYQIEDDQIVRKLCRQSGYETSAETRNKCWLGPEISDTGNFYPGVRMEILSKDPIIMRFYDIISIGEAEHLQRVARPRLERSTIMLSGGQQTSNFRIAKTAWLRGDSDAIVKRIEDRLAATLNIELDKSELLQVVNYGLGGFYGPHLDSSRASNASRNDSVLVDQLKRSDRFATILLYLNDVDVGGSTVFPLLNLTVTPIGRSAIVWFNLLENGYSDERTLHTGCPVSLGSKWVAVKWPREEANSFPRKNQWWRRIIAGDTKSNQMKHSQVQAAIK
jgi:prolyl 4-hydroxylase